MRLRPVPPPFRRPTAGRLFLAIALGVLAGCGEEGAPRPPPGPAPREPATARSLPPVEPAARARFWLERIATGPRPRTESFTIPHYHNVLLGHSINDLIAMPQETLALLSSVDVWERLGAPPVRDWNPLHAILDVLTAIHPKPIDVALRWAESGLSSPYLPLHRRATKLLATLRDPAAGPLLVEALEQDAEDREVGPSGVRALASLGSPWRERMVEIVYRKGTSELWSTLGSVLDEPVPEGRPRSDGDDVLAWWALLTETGGPRMSPAGAAKKWIPPWSYARLFLDSAARFEDPGPEGAGGIAYVGPHEPSASYHLGTLPTSPAASSVLPLDLLALTGRLLAGKVRCALAVRGHRGHQESVRLDRSGPDETLRATVQHCPFERDPGTVAEGALAKVRQFVADALAGNPVVDDVRIAPLLRLLPTLDDEGYELLVTILRDLRPAGAHRGLLEDVYDTLARDQHDRAVAEVARLLASPKPEDAGVARHLIHRSRDPDYVPALEQALARAPASLAPEYQRILWWIHSGGGIEPARADAFARTYARWVEEAPDDRAAILVTGLLDLGEAGNRAYAEGLRGPRRRIFLLGLLEQSRTVSIEVAEALLAPIDARTPPEERQAAWIASFLAAPPEAADLLAAAMDRIDPAAREEVVDVLDVVRHRAPRSATR